MTATSFKFKTHTQVCRRQIGVCPVGPFDQANALLGKVFVQSCIKELFRNAESIKIKVI